MALRLKTKTQRGNIVSITIRNATKSDAALILQFIVELARYEKAEHEVKANIPSIEQTIFGANTTTHALICERDGRAIGFAVYFFNYSTWQGKNGLYLEDLYVQPEERGSGAGKQLLQYLAKLAIEKNCGRFEWSVLDWNEPAIRFYESIGAKAKNEWVAYQLAGEALVKLAKG